MPDFLVSPPATRIGSRCNSVNLQVRFHPNITWMILVPGPLQIEDKSGSTKAKLIDIHGPLA